MPHQYQEFLKFVRKVAYGKRETAGYNGEYNDGGAGHLEQVAEAFEYGLIGTIPPVFQKYYADFTKQTDPEYEKYLELKKKFA